MSPTVHPRCSANARNAHHASSRSSTGSDRVGRHEAHPAVDGVGDERVAVEEPLLVVAQREVVERAEPVAPHEVARPQLGGATLRGGVALGEPAVDDGARGEVQDRDGDGEPDGEHRGVDEVVDLVRERDGRQPRRAARRRRR